MTEKVVPPSAVRTAARILVEIGDASGFCSSAHLPAHTGLHLPPAVPAAASVVKTPPVEETSNSNEPCTSPPSPHCVTPNHRVITSGNGPKENTTSLDGR